MPPSETSLLDYDRPALAEFFEARGHKPWRASQVFRRLHAGEDPPAAFADLPKALREELAGQTACHALPVATDNTAADGTRKWLFDAGGAKIETVLIPETRRQTLCVSSQAGCALACKFCLTGRQGFARNLSAAEIVSQLRQANRMQPLRVTNVVFMGMGEPLLNWSAVQTAIRVMIDPLGYALSPKRVTVSTAGVVPAMARMTEEAGVSLAVSLHAPSDGLRDSLMPINRKYPLADLLGACRRHVKRRPRAFVTFEYVMLRGVNDGAACARDLVRLLHGLRCKVNLIPFNPFPGAPFESSPRKDILAFRNLLNARGIVATIRKTRGDDILAACGQLAGDVQPRTMGLGVAEAPVHGPAIKNAAGRTAALS